MVACRRKPACARAACRCRRRLADRVPRVLHQHALLPRGRKVGSRSRRRITISSEAALDSPGAFTLNGGFDVENETVVLVFLDGGDSRHSRLAADCLAALDRAG